MTRTPVRHVVYLHGFASSPESGKAQRFASELAARGVGFTAPDLNLPAFETLTTTRMLAQVRDAVAQVPEGPIALVGSSLGAFVAVLAAAQDTTGRIDRLILLAPALDFGGNRLTEIGPYSVDEWRRAGSIRVFHYALGEEREVGYALYSDGAQYDALVLPTTLPTLVFMGDQDACVRPTMVRQWAEGRPLVDLHRVDDGHQLTKSMDLIWFESARFLGLGSRHFGVHAARALSHPLHVAGAEAPLVACRVLVLDRAFENVRNRLEAAMRVIGCADGLARTVGDRSELVDQQERIDKRQAGRGDRATNDEATALGLAVRVDDAEDVSVHGDNHGYCQ